MVSLTTKPVGIEAEAEETVQIQTGKMNEVQPNEPNEPTEETRESTTTPIVIEETIVKMSTVTITDGEGHVSKREAYEETIKTLTLELESAHQLRLSASPSGHLGNLTPVQHRKLINLWGMLIEYLQRDYDERAAKKKDKQLMAMLFDQSMETASSTSSLTVSETDRSEASSGRSSAIHSNPLSDEFWCQAGTGDLDSLLLRFLRARKWDLNAAFQMLIDTLEWRKTYGVRELIQAGEAGIKKELLASGKSFFWNVDRNGRLVTVITGRLHDKSAQTLEETCKFTVYQMELGRRLLQAPAETVTVVFDMADAPMASFDLGSIQFMVQCFQNFYPESLGKCLIVNPPWIFSGFFRMVKPLLDPVVAAKIEMVYGGEDMYPFIPAENLLERFGGKNKYEYKYVEGDPSERVAPLPEERVLQIQEELIDLQTRLIDTTISLNALYLNMSELDLTDHDPTILALDEMRQELKHEIGARWALLDGNNLPKCMYDRMGVIAPNGKVNWPKV